jgi:glutamyl-tRNA synthetase
MNGQYLARISPAELAPLVARELVRQGVATDAVTGERRQWFEQLLEQLKVRGRTVVEIARQAAGYMRDEVIIDPEAAERQWKDPAATTDILVAARGRLAALDAWTPDAMEATLRELAESRGVGAGKLFQPLRVALTGSSASPGIFDVLLLLGRERSLARIDAAVARLCGPGA